MMLFMSDGEPQVVQVVRLESEDTGEQGGISQVKIGLKRNLSSYNSCIVHVASTSV